ncbi:hypothetical protein HU200_054210 [Digitaria exilis]|uniref:KIB1-4 beta-propeller domain-containing protein n=1 Tax=Digitaria exilis TaxID=1010633 RepID=A0A835E5N2_9POAL|nr:hypothetical protein HU200_054210 [Digitaria exilis]
MSSEQMTPRPELPCIAFHDYDRSTVTLSLSEHKRITLCATTADEALSNKVICPTAQGLLLLRDPDTMATFFWNPMTGDEVVELPPLREVGDDALIDSHCLLSDHIAAPGGVVLLVEGGDDTVFWYCRLNEDDARWTKHEYDIGSHVLPYPDKDDEIEKEVICSIAACCGTFYFDCAGKDLRTIDFSAGAEPVVTAAIAIDGDMVDKRLPCQVFLVESDGELYMVRLFFALPYDGGDEIDGVGVYKMDFSGRRWRAVSDLGGRAFLLSPFYFGASCCAGDEYGVLPDCVYFVIHWSKTLQVFDVQQGTYQLHKLDEAPEVVNKAFWLLPTGNA